MKCFFDKRASMTTGDIDLQLINKQRSGGGEIEAEDRARIFVLLNGEAIFKVKDKGYRAKRSDIFSVKPAALYLPPNRTARIESRGDGFLMLSAAIRAGSDGYPRIIKQKEVKTEYKGKGGTRKKERSIFSNDSFSCGETICLPGKWSVSECDGFKALFFTLRPKTGLGFMRTKSRGREEVNLIDEGCIISFDGGEETIAAEPDTTICALWFMKKVNNAR